MLTYTIYPGHYDPAPGRGVKPVQVGITFKPTPCLTIEELQDLISELQEIEFKMLRTQF